jgi:hypothetical protein
LLCTCQSLRLSVGLVLQDGSGVNTAAIPAQITDRAHLSNHPNWNLSSQRQIHTMGRPSDTHYCGDNQPGGNHLQAQ